MRERETNIKPRRNVRRALAGPALLAAAAVGCGGDAPGPIQVTTIDAPRVVKTVTCDQLPGRPNTVVCPSGVAVEDFTDPQTLGPGRFWRITFPGFGLGILPQRDEPLSIQGSDTCEVVAGQTAQGATTVEEQCDVPNTVTTYDQPQPAASNRRDCGLALQGMIMANVCEDEDGNKTAVVTNPDFRNPAGTQVIDKTGPVRIYSRGDVPDGGELRFTLKNGSVAVAYEAEGKVMAAIENPVR